MESDYIFRHGSQELQDDLMEDFRMAVLPVSIVICVEIIFGLVSNAIVLYGYSFRYPRCTYRSLILCLAFVDIFSCLTTMPAEVFTEMFWFKFSFLKLCKGKSFFNVFILSLEILLLLIIAMDRYKQVCRTNTVQISSGFVMYLFAGSCVVSMGLAIPAAVGFGHHRYNYEHNGVNVSVVICGLTDEYSHGNFDLIYSVTLQTTACLSLTAMFIIYIIVLKTICSGTRDIELSSETTYLISRDQDEFHSTKQRSIQMSIVSFLFILTSLNARVIGFIFNTNVDRLSIKNTVIVLCFYRLYFVNHMIHPIIYGILDSKFRAILTPLFFNCRRLTRT